MTRSSTDHGDWSWDCLEGCAPLEDVICSRFRNITASRTIWSRMSCKNVGEMWTKRTQSRIPKKQKCLIHSRIMTTTLEKNRPHCAQKAEIRAVLCCPLKASKRLSQRAWVRLDGVGLGYWSRISEDIWDGMVVNWLKWGRAGLGIFLYHIVNLRQIARSPENEDRMRRTRCCRIDDAIHYLELHGVTINLRASRLISTDWWRWL